MTPEYYTHVWHVLYIVFTQIKFCHTLQEARFYPGTEKAFIALIWGLMAQQVYSTLGHRDRLIEPWLNIVLPQKTGITLKLVAKALTQTLTQRTTS